MSELEVVLLDNHLLVVAKPAGLPTVPDDSGDDSLLERAKRFVAAEFSKPGAVYLGVIQRLDRPVSGLVCFARTSKAAARLNRAMQAGEIGKSYLALTERPVEQGSGDRGSGELVQWLTKDPATNRVTASAAERAGAKRAHTRWRWAGAPEVLGAPRSLLELEPVTGRSHQLRLAARSLGSPLLGDLKYGAAEPLPDRSIALHARALRFEHPVRREPLELELAPPNTAWWRAAAGR